MPPKAKPDAEPRPLFLFSMPRAGSTLVQRVLGAHPAIATASEPWILVPLLYSLRPEGAYAEYGHRVMVTGVEDFCAVLPEGRSTYLKEVATFARRLYAQAAAGSKATYFLDKTPRYHVIAADILEAFPDARAIFLWRQPLAVAASIVSTWGGGAWNLHSFRFDLEDGLAGLVAAHRKHADRVHAVRYEDLVGGDPGPWRAMFDYLGLEFTPDLLGKFAGVKLEGRLGDPTGVHQYQKLSSEPMDKWKPVMAPPLRKAWCRRYLSWVGPERLAHMGYDEAALLAELNALSPTLDHLGSDLARQAYGSLARAAKPWNLQQRVIDFTRWRRRLTSRAT